MSNVVGELTRVRDAFDRPTLRLLASKWAALRVAIINSTFSRERRAIPADSLHTQVDAYLAQLVVAGVEVPSNATGRSLCLLWMRDQWLYRANGAEGEEYSLTSHAQDAISIVNSLMSGDRALISESRLTMILDEVKRCALEAMPDADSRIERLGAQICELTAERDRLLVGGEVMAATNERMRDRYNNLLNLISQIPNDFKRVEESMLTMHREILQDFREEIRPIGEVLDEYLAKSDDLVRATAEGRAFEGAFVLLRDEALLMELHRNLQVILGHSFAEGLSPAKKQDFLSAVLVIRQGTEDVLAQRRRLSATLREHIVNHDTLRERELEHTLRVVENELQAWMETAGPRSLVPIELLPGRVDLVHLRERFYDPAAAAPPLPLEDVSEDAPEPLSLDQIRKHGGPSLSVLRQTVLDMVAAGDMESIGAMFNSLPEALRRPVEILGLLHLAEQADALEDAAGVEIFDAVRPDGTHRAFQVPRVVLTNERAAGLSITEQGGAG